MSLCHAYDVQRFTCPPIKRDVTSFRFFREKPCVAASHGAPAAAPPREEMTATARLRLDEASRLFPEAHRPHERRPKQERRDKAVVFRQKVELYTCIYA